LEGREKHGSHPASELLTNFYEKARKTEISEKPAFTNAEQDWRMPLILQGNDFLLRFVYISATYVFVRPNTHSS